MDYGLNNENVNNIINKRNAYRNLGVKNTWKIAIKSILFSPHATYSWKSEANKMVTNYKTAERFCLIKTKTITKKYT